MNPFEPGGPQVPPAFAEIPTPDIPSANFVDIGRQISQGLQGSQYLDTWAQKILDILGKAVARIIAAIWGLVDFMLIKAIQLIFAGMNLNESGMDQLAATVVSGMTGVPVSAASFSDARNRSAREPVAASVVDVIQKALSVGQPAPGAGELTPSSAGAEAFLKIATHMAIEGWIFGIIAEFDSLKYLDHVGDLKDTLEHSLGIGRLSRRALAAPMKVLVEDPYMWKLNTAYRPTLPGTELLVRQYIRGILSRSDLDKFMGYHGYGAANVEALINFSRAHLSPGEIETLRLHNQITDAEATAALRAQGYDDATAASAQVALAAGRHDTWARLLVQEALVGLEKRYLTPADFNNYLQNSGLPSDERGILTLYANLKLQFSRKRFTVAEGEQLVKKGLWTLDQFRQLATDLGYNLEDEIDLELLTLLEIRDAADAAAKKAAAAKARSDAAAAKAKALAAKAAAAAAAAEAKGVGIHSFETLVLDGHKTIDQYRAFLAAKGIAADNVTALSEVLQAKLDQAAAVAAAHPGLEAGAKAHNVDLAQLETAVKDGSLSLAEFQTRAEGIGFSAEDVQLLTASLQSVLDSQKVKADAKAAAAARAKAKGVDLAQEQHGVRLGLITIEEYSAHLDALGFAPESRDLLIEEMKAQVAADSAARATKAKVAAALQQKGLSLPQLELAVRNGIRTMDDYRAALAKAGYDTATQDALVSLLQLRVTQDQETLAARGRGAGLLTKVGLSLTDLERAVKLGVVPVTVYTDALKRAGVSDADAKVLTLSAVAQVKAARTAIQTFAAVDKQLKLVGLNLTNLEQDVIKGIITPEQLQALLAGAGVADADVQAVMGLVRDELANAQHIAQLDAAVASSAAAKGLSLVQEEAAVRANVKTLDDFRRFVAGLGYSAADVETLTATLATKLKTPAAAPPAVP